MTIKYRGFIGNLEIDLETKLIIGKVQNIRAALLYQGSTIDEAVADFHMAVDEYLADCEKRGIAPEQSFNGVFQVRVSSETHFALATEAAEAASTLNAVVARVLDKHVRDRAGVASWSNRWADFLRHSLHSVDSTIPIEVLTSSLISSSPSKKSSTDLEGLPNMYNVTPLFPEKKRLAS